MNNNSSNTTLYTKLKEFFNFLQQITTYQITEITLTPQQLSNELYVCGFKQQQKENNNDDSDDDNYTFLVHVKKLKQINTTTITEPLEDMYLPINIIRENLLLPILTQMKTHFFKLKGYVIVILEFTDNKIKQQQIIIYDDKHVACRETLKIRKQYQMVKHKLIQVGEKIITQQKTEEELQLDIVTQAE